MQYRELGRTGWNVSAVSFGAWAIGGAWGTVDDRESLAALHKAVDLGVNFIDTADVYVDGASEEVIGRALKETRNRWVLATKVPNPMGKGQNERGLNRIHVKRAVEASLRRLQTDHIDLYQLHRPDPLTPIEETLEALTDLVREGSAGSSCWTSPSAGSPRSPPSRR